MKKYVKRENQLSLEDVMSDYLYDNSAIIHRIERERRMEKAIDRCGEVIEILLVLLPTILPVIAGLILGFLSMIQKLPIIPFLDFVFKDNLISLGESLLILMTYTFGCFLICLIPLALVVIVTGVITIIHNYRVRHLLSRSIIDVIAKEHGILMSLQFIPGFWDRPLIALRAFVEN